MYMLGSIIYVIIQLSHDLDQSLACMCCCHLRAPCSYTSKAACMLSMKLKLQRP